NSPALVNRSSNKPQSVPSQLRPRQTALELLPSRKAIRVAFKSWIRNPRVQSQSCLAQRLWEGKDRQDMKISLLVICVWMSIAPQTETFEKRAMSMVRKLPASILDSKLSSSTSLSL